MRKTVSIILAFAMMFTLTFPTIAAEQKKLTYDERVKILKDEYGITYGAGQYADFYASDSETKTAALGATEYALKRLGSSAMRTVASPFTKNNGNFSIRYGGVAYNGMLMNGVYDSGNVTFTAKNPTQFNQDNSITADSYNSQDPNLTSAKTAMAYAILHEIGHAYDVDFLRYSGTNAMKPYTGNFGRTLTSKSVPYTVGDATEDFAITFSWILISDKSILEWWYYNKAGNKTNITKNDLVYKQCETVYGFMLRDFGASSAAVKRAAKFLGKELPQ